MKALANQGGRERLGALLYVAFALQYFAAQLAIAAKFQPHYSLARNTISDLGNTRCAAYGHRFVCSPDHLAMNVSFVLLGLAMITGAWLFVRSKRNRTLRVGFGLFAVGGLGTILVGLFPENTVPVLHGLGAAAPFLPGNLGLVVLGLAWRISRTFRFYTLITGILGLLALSFYITHHYLNLGQGGIERLVAYPQTVWMIVTGLFFLTRRESK